MIIVMDIFFFSQLDPISPHQPQQLTQRPHWWSQEIAVRDGRIVLKVLQENKPPKYLKQKAFIPGIGNLVMKGPRTKGRRPRDCPQQEAATTTLRDRGRKWGF